jgi:hypothetical protein
VREEKAPQAGKSGVAGWTFILNPAAEAVKLVPSIGYRSDQ